MHRTDRFRIAGMYALDLATLTAEPHEHPAPYDTRYRHGLNGSVDAVWFRRKNGATRACKGTLRLWAHGLTAPVDTSDPLAVLTADLDGRGGGVCTGRWDGRAYWGAGEPEVMAAHLAVLKPMLAAYPAIPDGYDGWWHF
ncbi:hypothetical protein [Glycomyces sp. YM15]|uniref:hypothetical protein n=1 Tax=Glycomyces sp. YM15 TaxID=2800446 RepID=UPI0019648C88|nr:hypothetical protein [Glycomyces sp. YM15]